MTILDWSLVDRNSVCPKVKWSVLHFPLSRISSLRKHSILVIYRGIAEKWTNIIFAGVKKSMILNQAAEAQKVTVAVATNAISNHVRRE